MYINNAFFTIADGQTAAAHAALTQLAHDVEKGEPGTWFYLIHDPNLDPGIHIFPPPAASQILFVEGYADKATFLEHHHGPILKAFIAQHGGLFLNMYGPTLPFMILQGMEVAHGFIRETAADPKAFQVEARWVIKPGNTHKVREALVHYVRQVREHEPETLMYTASIPDTSADSPNTPPVVHDRLIYNSSWTDFQAFLDHGSGSIYQDFLKEHGDLFVQALGQPTSNHPYMTTSVMKRFAGFFRPQAFGVVE
jgi:quinol monooxygenase YgiN